MGISINIVKKISEKSYPFVLNTLNPSVFLTRQTITSFRKNGLSPLVRAHCLVLLLGGSMYNEITMISCLLLLLTIMRLTEELAVFG